MTATPMRQMADSDPAVTVGSELVEDDSPGEETSYEHASNAKTRAPLELTELGASGLPPVHLLAVRR